MKTPFDITNFGSDLRGKIEDLVESAKASNHEWSEWEEGFIESLSKKLEHEHIHVSPNQLEKIDQLWEKL